MAARRETVSNSVTNLVNAVLELRDEPRELRGGTHVLEPGGELCDLELCVRTS
jgi:hypothetical protein